MDDEEESTFLAYTKSPKITKRTSFQDELKKAVSARVSRQQAIEELEHLDYSDEFESDDSLDNSFQITKPTKSKSRKSLHKFHFSDDEDNSHGKMSFIKTKKQEKVPDDSVITDSASKEGFEPDLPKTPSSVDVKREHLQTANQDQKPIPKPRESKMKHSPSPPISGISVLDETFKPTPQHKNRDNTLLSAPSSIARLNDKLSASEVQPFSESCSPEGLEPSNSPAPRLQSPPVSEGQKGLTVTKEESSVVLKDLKTGGDGQRETGSHVNGRGSPSALEMLLTNVKEKSIQQENKDPIYSEISKLYDSSEQDAILLKKDEQTKINLEQKTQQSLKLTQSSRPLLAPLNKKSVKPMKLNSAKSRYLGTLTILDKSIYEFNGELEAADTLRATVYQNWLEKKKAFLQEVRKIKKDEEQKEKQKLKLEESMKKEEAMAAFMAWKAEKKDKLKEIQKNHKETEKKKMEELQDIARRKQECRRAFEKWKESKEDHLKEKAMKEKVIEKEKKLKEQKTTLEKNRNNGTAFKTWNERKELVLKVKKQEVKNEKLNLEKIKSEKEEKEKRALEMYEKWLEKKERQEKFEKRQKRLQIILDDEPPPPWSPPGKTIPAGR